MNLDKSSIRVKLITVIEILFFFNFRIIIFRIVFILIYKIQKIVNIYPAIRFIRFIRLFDFIVRPYCNYSRYN